MELPRGIHDSTSAEPCYSLMSAKLYCNFIKIKILDGLVPANSPHALSTSSYLKIYQVNDLL